MDLLVAATAGVLIVFTVMGMRIGLIRRVLEFAGVLASFFAASALAPILGGLLQRAFDMSQNAAVAVSWVVVFLAGLLLTRWAAKLIAKIVRVSILGWIDRCGGAVFGLLIGTLFCSVLLLGATQLPGGEKVRDRFTASVPTQMIYEAAPRLYSLFRKMGVDERRVLEQALEFSKERLGAANTVVQRGREFA